jgi:hypothetical protein
MAETDIISQDLVRVQFVYVKERAWKHEAFGFVRGGVAPEYKSDCRVF